MKPTRFDDVEVRKDLRVIGEVDAKEVMKFKYLGEHNFDSAASGTAKTLYTLPEGAIITEVFCVVSEAFNAVSTNVLILGTAATADALMAASDVTEGTPATYRKDAWLVGAEGGTAVKSTYTQTGTAASTGAAKFYAKVIDRLS